MLMVSCLWCVSLPALCAAFLPACSLPARPACLPACLLACSLAYLLSLPGVPGKTTFLRALAGGEIKGLPTGCQVLHVEQEVAGDDTSVMQVRVQQ